MIFKLTSNEDLLRKSSDIKTIFPATGDVFCSTIFPGKPLDQAIRFHSSPFRAIRFEDIFYHPASYTIFMNRYGYFNWRIQSYDHYTEAKEWFDSHDHSDSLVYDYNHGTLKIKESSDIVEVSDSGCYLWGKGDYNFGHFIYETLTRNSAHQWAHENRLLFNWVDTGRSFEKLDSWSNLLGYHSDRSIQMRPNKLYHFKEVWFTEPTIFRDKSRRVFINYQSLLNFKSTIEDQFRSLSIVPGRIVYISRADATHRRLLNREELIGELAIQSDSVFLGSSQGLLEQINKIRRAEVIIAEIGAASAVTTFANTSAKIIELSPSSSIFGMFNSRVFAALFHQPFIRINGSPVENISHLKADYTVDVSYVKNVLVEILKY